MDRNSGACVAVQESHLIKFRTQPEPDMKQFPSIDLSLVLSLATVLGMAMAAAGKWLPGNGPVALGVAGLMIVYLAAGLPTALRAISALWRGMCSTSTC